MKRLRIASLLPLAGLSLVAGLATGLVRVGWPLPLPRTEWATLHGPVMAVGFLSVLVALERAVALARGWAFAAPAGFAAAALAALAGVDGRWCGALATAAALVNLLVLVRLVQRVRRPPGHLLALAAGALALVPAHLSWAVGHPPHASAPWWIAFVVVTIGAERWERARLTGLPRGAPATLAAAFALLLAGAAVPHFAIEQGLRPLAPGLLAVAAWMLLHDSSWAALRAEGERRHVALCTLAGHLWLLAAGLLAASHGEAVVGPHWDAVLHALFVGVLFSMIFAHAPIVLGPLLGLRLSWTPLFHLAHALLHAGLLLRIGGDLLGGFEARRWGALLNVAAILSFAVLALARARRP